MEVLIWLKSRLPSVGHLESNPRYNNRLIHLIFLLFFTTALPASAQTVTPLRAVLTPETNQATFSLSNPTGQTKSIRLGWLHLTADENGAYHHSSTPDQLTASAAPFLSLSPAAFQLAPGETRKINVRLRKNAVLTTRTEWRSHLLIESETRWDRLRPVSARLGIDMSIAISVPVVLRASSALQNGVRIKDTRLRRLADGGLSLDIMMNREGDHSIYGAIKAEAIAAPKMPAQIVALRENISLYPETSQRFVSIDLGVATLPEGQFDITFEGRGEYAGKIFARRIFNVGSGQPRQGTVKSQLEKGAPPNSVTIQ